MPNKSANCRKANQTLVSWNLNKIIKRHKVRNSNNVSYKDLITFVGKGIAISIGNPLTSVDPDDVKILLIDYLNNCLEWPKILHKKRNLHPILYDSIKESLAEYIAYCKYYDIIN